MEKRGINKRGISPFIAAVILIIVVVAVGIMIAGFIRSYVSLSLDSTQEKQLSCATDVNFRVYEIGRTKQIFYDGDNITVMLQNIGTSDIYKFSIVVTGTEGISQGDLKPGELKISELKNYGYFSYDLSKDNIGIPESATISAVVRQGNEIITCTNVKETLNYFNPGTLNVDLSEVEGEIPGAGSCTLDGVTVLNGSNRLFYNSSNVSCEFTECFSQLRNCTDGDFDGDSSFNQASCEPVQCEEGEICDNGVCLNFNCLTYAYVGIEQSSLGNALLVYCVENPENITLISTRTLDAAPRGTDILGNRLYVSTAGEGLYIFDISNPDNISQLGKSSSAHAINTHSVKVKGDYAFVGEYSRGVIVLDISDPQAIIDVAQRGGNACRLTIQGDYLYKGGCWGSVGSYNISNPQNPILLYETDLSGHKNGIALKDNFLFIATHFWPGVNGRIVSYNISNPNSLVLSAEDHALENVPKNLFVYGNYLYSFGNFGLKIIDISNPHNLILSGISNIGSRGVLGYVSEYRLYSIAKEDHYSPHKIRIFDVSNPSNLIELGDYVNPFSGLFTGIHIKNY